MMKNGEMFPDGIAIFGTGDFGQKAYHYFGKEKVKLFIDNNKNKQGTQLYEKEIISLEKYKKESYEYNLVIAIKDCEEVVRQVFAFEIDECWSFYMQYDHARLHRFNREEYIGDNTDIRYQEYCKRGEEEKKNWHHIRRQRWDICLTGLVTELNYGAQLTYFALYRYLNEMGFTVLMNQPPLSSIVKPSRFPMLFNINPYPSYDICRVYDCKSQMIELNEKADCFMLGSDQMWNMEIMFKRDYVSDMKFVKKKKKMIAYATSFGKGEWDGNDKETKIMKYSMERFSAVSVRERSGIEICKKNFGINVVHCLDPVFICDPQIYYHMIDSAVLKPHRKAVVSYIFGMTEALRGDIKYLADQSGLVCYEMYPSDLYLEDWLNQLCNAKIVVTNSYHAMCLAIIFRVDFWVLKFKWPDRIEDLTRLLGLENRVISSANQLRDVKEFQSPIDYDSVWLKLEKMIQKSKKWLGDRLLCQ